MTKDQAKKQIEQLIVKYAGLSADDKKNLTEATVVHQFINPLLQALGWPIGDPAYYRYEQSTIAGRPDMMLTLDSGERIFLEAKRFGKIQQLDIARNTLSGIITPGQMALPGMATDRTAEEQQAINYAFKNDGRWAILTNFEKLRLFNARRDWLVLSFEEPRSYLDDFDHLWQLAYENVEKGGLDVLSGQRVRADVDTDYLNFINEWRQKLAQDILDRPAQNPWAFAEDGSVRLADLRGVVQRVLDRLVIIRYAEDHLIAPAGTLYNVYELTRTNLYTFSLSQHVRQLFRGFDDQHNSALFAPHLADRADFSNAALGGLVEKLYEARYRAMTPDIMGNTYEQYLGKALVLQNPAQITTRDNLETRKKQGSYYTPQVIVRYIVDNSLGRYLYGSDFPGNSGVSGEIVSGKMEGEPRKTWEEIADLRLIDPACGSGSFLIYAYEVLADFYRGEIKRVTQERQARYDELVAGGMTIPFELGLQLTPYKAALETLRHYPRLILERHLYGTDLDPQAAEIATVNLIMRAMADQRGTEKRLPLILNQNVKVGNALIGSGPDDPRLAEHAGTLTELRRLRLELAAGQNGHDHAAKLAQVEALTAVLNTPFNEDLSSYFPGNSEFPGKWEDHIRPLHWAVAFPEVFLDEAGRPLPGGGFTIVVGNPPWEIVKPDLREYYAQFDADVESKLARAQAERRIAELNAAGPEIGAGWERQKARIELAANYYKSSAAYTRQGRGDTATHKLFTERGYTLLRDGGRMGFVIPSGIYSDLGTKELREMLLNEGRIEYLYNFSNERFFFPAVDHRVKFTLLGVQKGVESEGFWAAFRFDPRVAIKPSELKGFLAEKNNLIFVKRKSLLRFSPDSFSVLEFQTRQDYEVTDKIYDELPLLGEELSDGWRLQLNREFDLANDRRYLNQNGEGIPYYEGKMIHQFDSFYAKPQFWVSQKEFSGLAEQKQQQLKTYRIAHRRIARATDERTLIATMVPRNTACDTNATVALIQNTDDEAPKLFLCAVFNSFVLDYVIRLRVSTTLNMFYMYQLPVPRLTAGNPFFDAIVPRAAALTCTTPAFADLWQSVMGTPWVEPSAAQKPGFLEKPGFLPTTDPAARQRLRDELDAIIAHLYGLSRDDFAHILATFPLVFPNTPAGAAKKAALLAVFDTFAAEFGG